MPSKLLSLLVVLLFAFDVSLVLAARPHLQCSWSHIDPKGLDPKIKRRLPPFPPVDLTAARGRVKSQCAKSGVIEVINADTNVSMGYVSRDLRNQRYALTGIGMAGTFSSSVFICGRTKSINLLAVDDGTHFLAGLIKKNEPLGDGGDLNDDLAAILGRSLATNPGDPPQADRAASIPDRDAETAIWTYDRADDSLTAIWVNYVGQHPSSTKAYISFTANGNKFYLTNTRISPRFGFPVLFRYVSVNDGCSIIGK